MVSSCRRSVVGGVPLGPSLDSGSSGRENALWVWYLLPNVVSVLLSVTAGTVSTETSIVTLIFGT